MSEDAFVFDGQPGTNYGTAAELQVKAARSSGYSRRTYIKASFVSSEIKKATLWIYVNSVGAKAFPVTVCGLEKDSWTEGAINWSNQPDTLGQSVCGSVYATAAGWQSVDITDYVKTQAQDKVVTLRLEDNTYAGDFVKFSSREGSNKPYISIEAASETATPTRTPTPTSSKTPTPAAAVTPSAVPSTSGSGTPVPDTQAPSKPSNLKFSDVTDTSLILSWTASTDNVGVKSYSIYKGTTKIGSTTGTSYKAAGLIPETAYTFYVAARDAAGNTSPKSTALKVTTSYPYSDEYTYDELGRLVKVEYENGDVLNIAYDSNGNITKYEIVKK